MAEWFKAPVLKTGRGLCSLVSSNLTPSTTKFVFQLLSHCFSSTIFQFRRTLFVVRADRNVQWHDIVGRFPRRNRIIAKPNPIGLPHIVQGLFLGEVTEHRHDLRHRATGFGERGTGKVALAVRRVTLETEFAGD